MLSFNGSTFVFPGDLEVIQGKGKLVTILGSCISVTAWHPKLKVGAMCHYLVPLRHTAKSHLKDNHFGNLALIQMTKQLSEYAELSSFIYGVFGGSTSINGGRIPCEVGIKNMDVAYKWAATYGIQFTHSMVLGDKSRRISLDVSSGNIHSSELESFDDSLAS